MPGCPCCMAALLCTLLVSDVEQFLQFGGISPGALAGSYARKFGKKNVKIAEGVPAGVSFSAPGCTLRLLKKPWMCVIYLNSFTSCELTFRQHTAGTA
jgi:hypothetical protein